MDITVEKSTENLRAVTADLESNEKTLKELWSLCHYCRHQVILARRLQADELIAAWEALTEAVETSYRTANLGLMIH